MLLLIELVEKRVLLLVINLVEKSNYLIVKLKSDVISIIVLIAVLLLVIELVEKWCY